MKKVDARGLSCPQPVILFKRALEDASDSCQVIVDSAISKENVSRFGAHAGYKVEVEEKQGDFYLNFRKV